MSPFKRKTLQSLAASVDYGVTASANRANVGPQFLRITDIQDDRVDWQTVPFCEATRSEEASARLEVGDIVFARTGATTGKSYLLRHCPERAVFASYLIRVRPDRSQVEPRYLSWFFQTTDYWRQITSSASGTAQPGVNASKLRELSVPTPELGEQRHIADILDKADALLRKRKATIALTEELVRSTFLEMFGDPVSNPKNWPVKALGEVLAEIESGWSPVCLARPATDQEWGVLKLGAVTFGRYSDSENKALGSNHSPACELEVKAGDILFARKNTYEHVAACVLVQNTRSRLMIPDLVFRLVLAPNSGVLPPVLWAMLSHAGKRRQIQGLAGGTAGSMPNISKERLRTVTIPVPPEPLQARFARELQRIENLRGACVVAVHEAEQLYGSLSNRAFSGQLMRDRAC